LSTKNFWCACLAPAFCVHWSVFVVGVTCPLGQTSAVPSLCDVVDLCTHARAHTGIGAHFCTHACLLAILPAAATCCRRLPHLLPLLALQKPDPRSLGFALEAILGRDPEKSDSGRVGRSLEHESSLYHTWHKPPGVAPRVLRGVTSTSSCC